MKRLRLPLNTGKPTPRQRVQLRIVYALQFAFVGSWLFYGVLYGAMGAYLSMATSFVVGFLPSAVALLQLRSSGNALMAGLISSLASATGLFLLTFTTGGGESPIASWYVALIIAAFIQLGIRLGFFVTLYCIFLLLAIIFILPLHENQLYELPFAVGNVWFMYSSYIASGSVAALMIGFYVMHFEEGFRFLQDAEERALAASKAKSEFLSSMSHELRTPMNAVLGFSQLMQYDPTLSDQNKENVEEILKAGYHLLDLINEVLDLAKIEAGRIDLSLEPVELQPVVGECLTLVGPLATKRGIRVSHSGLEGMAVRADLVRLKQVLLNLLSNAVKYNREGGSVSVTVEAGNAERLRIRVTDTGPGIPVGRLKELFQPFNRLGAESSGIEGTGIGLTITRQIVEMMGGTVDVESDVGIGSTFWIELPRETVADAGGAVAEKVGAGDTPARGEQEARHTVLYVEDNPANLRLVAQILGRHQHIRLLTAHIPTLGIELAQTRRPDLILLDINMPGMDGYQVLAAFKADADLKEIPVVAVTANAMPGDIERGRAAGFADYLTKPLDVARFNKVVDRLLDKSPRQLFGQSKT